MFVGKVIIYLLIEKFSHCIDDGDDLANGGDGLYGAYINHPDIADYIEKKGIVIDYENFAREATYYNKLNALIWLQSKGFIDTAIPVIFLKIFFMN